MMGRWYNRARWLWCVTTAAHRWEHVALFLHRKTGAPLHVIAWRALNIGLDSLIIETQGHEDGV